MVLGNHQLESQRFHRSYIRIDSHAEYLGLLATIDRQHAVRRHTMQRLVEVEVIVELLILLRVVFRLRADELARLAIDLANSLPQFGIFAELLGQNVPRAQQRAGRIGHALVGVDEVGRAGIQIGGRFVLGEDLRREQAEPLLLGLRGERLLLRPIGQVQVFEPLHAVGPFDLLAQLRRQRVLRLDRLEDRLLTLLQLSQLRDARADGGNLLFVEPARLIAAVAGDERHGVAFIEQRDRAGNRLLVDAEFTRQAP